MSRLQLTITRRLALCSTAGGALLLAAAGAASAGVVEGLAIESRDAATRVEIATRGDVRFHDFTLRNPDRVVVDFRGSTSSLPPSLPPEALAGVVAAVRTSVWDADGEEPLARVVLELARRASYSIARHKGSVVVVLENGAPSAGDLGYDEDHLAMARPDGARPSPAAASVVTPVAGEQTAPRAPSTTVAMSTPSSPPPSGWRGRAFSSHVYGRGARLEDPPPGLAVERARRVSLDVQRANILTVVRTLGQLSGRNIVTDASVAGEVTLNLTEVPWPQALDIVLLTQGLGFTDEEGVIRIATIDALRQEEVEREEAARKREELLPVRTEVFAINFAKAEELKPRIEKMLSGRGHAEYDPRTNALIVTDNDQKLAMTSRLVAQLDTKTPQVEIDARMIDIDVAEATDIGIDWTMTVTQGGAGDLNRPQSASNTTPITNPAGELRIGALRPNWTLDAVIQALVNERQANIISNPRITTVNNRAASILVGQEIPLVVQDEAFNTVIQLKQIGIKLSVRPHINSDHQIELDIHPEVSDLSTQSTVQGGIIINTSEADTRVLVSDGATAVIGGLVREVESVTERGIPVLKNIPALGWLFKSTNTVRQKRELVIFITPRIVDS